MRYAVAMVYLLLMPFLLLAAAVYNLLCKTSPHNRQQHLPRREPAE
jgi:hypothetical protein